ncbi:MAG: Na+/H+ antiporter NhaA, partial [Nitrospirae bacterium]
GLMTFFFFTVGLEIKREMLVGELSTPRRALLPACAALGGMVVPAVIYFLINHEGGEVSGWGIPMATDIAFALGVLYILGKRVPTGLRVFLSAFAIADDLGAVLVIALFYTHTIAVNYLSVALLLVIIMMLASYFWVRSTLFYAVLGLGLWFAVLGSGLHATVVGIIVAFLIPARGRYDTDRFIQEVQYYMSEFQCPIDGCGHSILLNQRHLSAVQSIELACHHVETPLQRLEHALHPWVAYLLIPLLALANAGVSFTNMDLLETIKNEVFLGVLVGLLIGKPLGIMLFTALFVKLKVTNLPNSVTWPQIFGVSLLGGIGFTMSLFIATLSFKNPDLLDYAKTGILIASFLSGVIGTVLLLFVTRQRHESQ